MLALHPTQNIRRDIPRFGLTPRTIPFTDVTPNDWAYDAIELVRKEGVFVGYPDGRFAPYSPLLRSEAAAVTANLIRGLRDGSLSVEPGLKSELSSLEKRLSVLEQRVNSGNRPVPSNNPFLLPPIPPPVFPSAPSANRNPFLAIS